MDEFEPTPSLERARPTGRGLKRGLHPVVLICIGSVIGGAFVHFARESTVPKAPAKPLIAKADLRPIPKVEEPKVETQPKVELNTTKPEAKPDDKSKPVDTGVKPQVAPVMPTMPVEIDRGGGFAGDISPLPSVSGSASKPGLETKPVEEGPEGLYVSGSGGSAGSLSSLATKLGGSSRKFSEYEARGKTSEGILIWVPDKNAKRFLDGLKAAGVDIVEQEEGNPGSRGQKITQTVRLALNRLKKQREELITKYFETAPAVLEIDSDIADANKSLASLKSPGKGFAVAKVELG